MRVDRVYMVTGTRKERRAQIAALGRKHRQMRLAAFMAKAARAITEQETK